MRNIRGKEVQKELINKIKIYRISTYGGYSKDGERNDRKIHHEEKCEAKMCNEFTVV